MRLHPLAPVAALGLAAALLCNVVSCAGPTRVARPPAPGERPLRVVTYNVNYGLAGDPATRAAIFAHDADVICLQETTPRWELTLRADPALAGYPYVRFVHHRGAGGQAILSRYPLAAFEAWDAPPPGWFPAVRAVVEAPEGPVQILALHLRPPFSDSGSFVVGYLESDDVHAAEITGHLAALDATLPTVVLGDLNEDLDGAAIERLTAWGLRDALSQFAPDAHTWRMDTGLGEVTHDLDHVLYGPGLDALDARVVEIGRSDHLPVVVELVRATPPTP